MSENKADHNPVTTTWCEKVPHLRRLRVLRFQRLLTRWLTSFASLVPEQRELLGGRGEEFEEGGF
jgi:hypothetical protein